MAPDERNVLGKMHPKRVHDGMRDLVLDIENIPHLAVISLRPELVSIRRIDQLRRDTHAVAGTAHAPFEDVLDIEPGADFADIQILAAQRKRGGPGSDAQTRQSCKRADHFLGQAIAEIFVFLVSAEIRERENGNRLDRT